MNLFYKKGKIHGKAPYGRWHISNIQLIGVNVSIHGNLFLEIIQEFACGVCRKSFTIFRSYLPLLS